MENEFIRVPKCEFEELKRKAEIDEELLVKLIKGLEDIRAGRITPWKRLLEFEDNISEGKRFTREDLGF